MQTLGIKQSDEEAIRVIVDQMLAAVLDRIDITETKSISKLYEVGVRYPTSPQAVTRRKLKTIATTSKFVRLFKTTIARIRVDSRITVVIDGTPYNKIRVIKIEGRRISIDRVITRRARCGVASMPIGHVILRLQGPGSETKHS